MRRRWAWPWADGEEPNFDPESFATLYIARDDARNYIVLGDPATRLRVKDLQ